MCQNEHPSLKLKSFAYQRAYRISLDQVVKYAHQLVLLCHIDHPTFYDTSFILWCAMRTLQKIIYYADT